MRQAPRLRNAVVLSEHVVSMKFHCFPLLPSFTPPLAGLFTPGPRLSLPDQLCLHVVIQGYTFFVFHRNSRSVRSTIVHFQVDMAFQSPLFTLDPMGLHCHPH